MALKETPLSRGRKNCCWFGANLGCFGDVWRESGGEIIDIE